MRRRSKSETSINAPPNSNDLPRTEADQNTLLLSNLKHFKSLLVARHYQKDCQDFTDKMIRTLEQHKNVVFTEEEKKFCDDACLIRYLKARKK
jgi:hypothetical protein